MYKTLTFRSRIVYAVQLCLLMIVAICSAQESKVMGEVRFEGATKVEKDSGVWVDGDYVGFLKELHGTKKCYCFRVSMRYQCGSPVMMTF